MMSAKAPHAAIFSKKFVKTIKLTLRKGLLMTLRNAVK